MHCVRASHSYSPEDEEDVELSEVVTPWASSVLTGSDLIRASKYNKGLAFSHAEREKLYLRGLLPPAELSQELQSERVMANVRETKREVDRLQYLLSLGERNEQLFHYVLAAHLPEILPLLEHPTTAAYCQKYSLMFRALPRALYVTSEDAGSVDAILRNWPERDVRVVCVTDGQECGPLGDLGVQAIGTPLSRLALYTAAGGVRPASCLPVVLDVGTDNARLLADPIYVGLKRRREVGESVDALRDELVASLRARYGPALLLDCEDMRCATAEAFVEACQGLFPAYSDAVHGFPAVVLAAILAALPSTHSPRLADHTFLFVGEGPELLAVVRLVEEAVLAQGGALGTVWDIRERIALADAKGLVVRERPDAEDYADGVLPYARDLPPAESLLQAVQAVKPTILVGLTRGSRPPHAFGQEVVTAMAADCERPVILPLSTQDVDGIRGFSEATAADVYGWTQGRALFADALGGSREVRLPAEATLEATEGAGGAPASRSDGKSPSCAPRAQPTRRRPSALSSVFVFPGVARGIGIARATALREGMLIAAAHAVAHAVDDRAREEGALLPPVDSLADVAAHVAAAVAHEAYAAGVATELPEPIDLVRRACATSYHSRYKRFG